MKLSLLFASLAYAQLLAPATVKDSVLKNFPLVEEAQQKVRAAEGESVAARGEFDTKLKVKADDRIGEKSSYLATEALLDKQLPISGLRIFGGHYRARGDVPQYTGKYLTSSSGELVAGLEIPLLRNRATDTARTGLFAAEQGYAIAEQDLRLKRNVYVHKALSSYEKWRLAHVKYHIRESLLRVAIERGKMLGKMVSAGDVERLRLVDNARAINKRQDELLSAEMELRQAEMGLGLYYLDQNGVSVPLKGVEPPVYTELSEPKSEEVAIATLPQVKIIEQELGVVRQREALARNQRLPALNLSVSGHRDLAPVVGVEPQRLQIGLQLEIPFENRKGVGKENAERAKAIALEQQQSYAVNEVRVFLEQTRVSLRTAWERSRVLKNEVENAETVVSAERRRWAQGDSDLYLVTLREQDLAETQIKLWSSHYEYEQARLDLRLLNASLAE